MFASEYFGRGRRPPAARGVWFALAALGASGLFSPAAALAARANLANAAKSHGQQYVLDVFGVDEGLPLSNIASFSQTRDGYLWVGTPAGLARFDGVRCLSFLSSNTPALIGHSIRHLYEDRAKNLWIATDRGVVRCHGSVFEHLGLADSDIRTIVEDQQGRIWIATDRQGIYLWQNGILQPDKRDPALSRVSSLFVDSADRLWAGLDDGVVCFENDRVRSYRDSADPRGVVQTITEQPKGTLWFGTTKGLFRLKDGVTTHYPKEEGGLEGTSVYQLRPAQDGGLWVLTGALQKISDPHAVTFETLISIDNLRLTTFSEDHEDNMWLGTRNQGLIRARKMPYRLLSAASGLPANRVKSVSADRAGNIYLVPENFGPVQVSPSGAITLLDEKQGFPPLKRPGEAMPHDANTALAASDGSLWVGFRAEPLHVSRNGTTQTFPELINVMSLYEDPRGTVWVGTSDRGVFRHQNGKFDRVELKPGVPVPNAITFGESPDGAMYIGTWAAGLFKVKDGETTVITRDDGLPANAVRAVRFDREGIFWLGLKERGLAVFDRGRWLNPNALAEAVGGHVSGIVEDRAGRLWLGTGRGVMWAWKHELLADARDGLGVPRLHLAGSSDGAHLLPIWGTGYPIAVETPDGRLLFATEGGAMAIDPEALFINEAIPPVHVETLTVDGKELKTSEQMEAPAGTRQIAIGYTALSFSQPRRVFFKYMLEGYDTDWVDAGTRRLASYTNLSPQAYTFRVKACNNDGVWNEQGAALRFSVQPFYYQTAWFRVATGLAVAATLLGTVRARIRRAQRRTAELNRQNQELERRIAERTAELAKSFETIRASEYFYHSLVESLPQIIVRKDAHGRFTYANTAFADLVGRPLDEIIGKPDADFYPPEKAQRFRADDLRAMETGQTLEYETTVEKEGRPRRFLHVKKVPLYDQQRQGIGVQILFWDITNFREIEEKLKQAQRELLETSRLAGIAEMATGILHNLGNALNSVNTTANLARVRVQQSKVTSVGKVAELLAAQNAHLAEFLTQDARGQKIPTYLAQLATHLVNERDLIVTELDALQKGVDQIKEMVAAQQSSARVAGITEVISPAEIVEYALRIAEASIERHGITVVRELTPAPSIKVERQKALQIVGNLVMNAKDSIKESGRGDKRITIGVRGTPEGRVQIYVTDNGTGIAPENLTRIFAFGFTTKKRGHGFGLHSSALAAKELGGSLTVTSEGLGRGATFVLELPAAS